MTRGYSKWFDDTDKRDEVLGLTPEAFRLWALAQSYISRNLTDGYVPRVVALQQLGGTVKTAGELVAAGLWELAFDGWQVPRWTKDQRSRRQVLVEREAGALRQKESRQRRRHAVTGGQEEGHVTGGSHGVTYLSNAGGVTA